jgi:hypothetical protein
MVAVPAQATSPADSLARFDAWFASLIERTRPDVIVAVARGAARFLQLRAMFRGQLSTPVFSHHALPFLDDSAVRGRRVLVFDDSIIYGSTMAEVSNYLTCRGALVLHAAYVANRRSFFGEGQSAPSPFVMLNPKIWKRLSPDDVRRHHASVVQELFHAGLDLNLDFPSICVRVDALRCDEVPYVAHLLASRPAFKDFENVTFPVTKRSEVQRWTALHDDRWTLPADSVDVVSRGHSKTRVTFIPERNELRLTPIVQYRIRRA